MENYTDAADYDPRYDLTSGQFDVKAWQDRERREAPPARWEFDAPSPIPPEIAEGTLTSEAFREGLNTVRQRQRWLKAAKFVQRLLPKFG